MTISPDPTTGTTATRRVTNTEFGVGSQEFDDPTGHDHQGGVLCAPGPPEWPGFRMLDSYLVTVARRLNPSPPVSQPQQAPVTDGAAHAAQTATAAEAAQTARSTEAPQAAITAQAAHTAAQAAAQGCCPIRRSENEFSSFQYGSAGKVCG